MTSLSDLTPGTRVKHLPTGAEGVVTAGRARLRGAGVELDLVDLQALRKAGL